MPAAVLALIFPALTQAVPHYAFLARNIAIRRMDIRVPRCLNTSALPSWRPIMKKLGMLAIVGGAALLTAAPFTLQWSQKSVSLSVDSAEARVGRPLTPFSVAGVNRRAYRRAGRAAVYAGAAAAAAATVYGLGAYYGGYGYPGYSYAAPSAPYYGTGYGYGPYYGGYGSYGGYGGYYSTAPYNPGPSFGFGWGY